MKLNEYRKIGERRYSPKEVLAHLVASSENVIDKNEERLMVSLEETFLQNLNNRNMLKFLNEESREKIINHWSLSIGQAMAYGHIVFHNILIGKQDFSQNEIADKFVFIMRFYSPDNAVDFAYSHYRKKV